MGYYTSLIKGKGLKVTGPRLKILELFENVKGDNHLSAEDVYKIILDEKLDIGIATVYRVLTQFHEVGILIKHNFDTGKAVYELKRGEHHDHFVCIKCGEIIEFSDQSLEEFQFHIAKKNNFTILNHALYIYGLCSKCSN